MKKNLMYYFLSQLCYWTPRSNERVYEFITHENGNVTLIESWGIPYTFGTFPIALIEEALDSLEKYAYNARTDWYEVEYIPVSLIDEWYNKYAEYLEPLARYLHVYTRAADEEDYLPF